MKDRHILLFDLHSEGHHLFWLGLLIDAFHEMHYRISLVVDANNPTVQRVLLPKIASYGTQIKIMSYPHHGVLKGSKAIHAAAKYLHESMADEVFFPSLDDIASTCFRKAAFGMLPPRSLCGKISGIYIRPRPLDKTQNGLANTIKCAGFKTIKKAGFFKKIFLLDKDLPSRTGNDENLFHFLPDPWEKPAIQSLLQNSEWMSGNDTLSLFSRWNKLHGGSMERNSSSKTGQSGEANRCSRVLQEALHIKKQSSTDMQHRQSKCTFLFYGTDSRRKGLSLMLEAFNHIQEKKQCFLLCAGQITAHGNHIATLELLEKNGLAKLFNYYISETEQDLLFRMTDFVVLPYIDHYGSSGILAHAAAYRKPVISSDFHLLGKRVKEYGLGLTFKNNHAESLKHTLAQALLLNKEDRSKIEHNLEKFAHTCSTDSFKSAIKDAYQ